MPQNCSKDISLVIDYMDNILNTGDAFQISNLKKRFKLQHLNHSDDFMSTLASGPYLWQDNDVNTGYSLFFQFCDYIENAVNTTGPFSASGVGAQQALLGYQKWWNEVYLPDSCYQTYGYDDFQGTYNTLCYDSYNASSPIFTDTSVNNWLGGFRQWIWLLCNTPTGWNQNGAPSGHLTIVSRLVNSKFWERQCPLYFPTGPNGETFGLAQGRTEAQWNAHTKGWDDRATSRLLYSTATWDPWKHVGVASDFRPGGPMKSTAQRPIVHIPGGFHCSDYRVAANSVGNPQYKAVIDSNVNQIAIWVSQWKKGSTGSAVGSYGRHRRQSG